jgi:hypothetical protein
MDRLAFRWSLPAALMAVALATSAQQPGPVSAPGGIDWTPDQRTVLADTSDFDSQLDTPAFYVLLEQAGRLAGGYEPNALPAIDRPAYASLLQRPGRYRAEPIALGVRVIAVQKLAVGAGLSATPRWPADRPIWELQCGWADADYPADSPLRIFSVVDPAPLLGPASRSGRDGRSYYLGADNYAPAMQLHALFFKVVRAEDREGNQRDFPVAVAWSMERSAKPRTVPAAGDRPGAWSALPLVLLAGIGAYALLRVYTWKLRKAGDRRPRYQPLREPTAEPVEPARDAEDAEEDVDPELKSAVETYRKEAPPGP